MRAVFVNHCHPELPHVCGTRVARFAESCARAGWQVVLLTQSLPGRNSSHTPTGLAEALAGHDWSRPLHVACAPQGGALWRRQRDGTLPRLAGKALVAAGYLLRSGVFTDWRDGAAPYGRILASRFRPQVTWGSFGNTDALAIARAVARSAGCAWAMDVKDPWSVFIPGPFQRLLARRFRDCAAITALSRAHADDLERHFGRTASVIYSGIDQSFLASADAPPPDGIFRLLLVGGLYDNAGLDGLLRGVGLWLERLPAAARARVRLDYAGGEGKRLKAAAGDLPLCLHGYLPLTEMRALAARAAATLYVRSPNALFQHKIFELLASGRPALCHPGEGEEAVALAAAAGGGLLSCADAPSVAAALERLHQGAATAADPAKLARYTWDAQGERLRQVLAEVAI